METQMRAELAQKQGMVGISEEQMAKLKEEAAIKAKEEVRVCVYARAHPRSNNEAILKFCACKSIMLFTFHWNTSDMRVSCTCACAFSSVVLLPKNTSVLLCCCVMPRAKRMEERAHIHTHTHDVLCCCVMPQAMRMEEERQKHASDAEKMKRKQAKIHEEAVRKQEDAEKVCVCVPVPVAKRQAKIHATLGKAKCRRVGVQYDVELTCKPSALPYFRAFLPASTPSCLLLMKHDGFLAHRCHCIFGVPATDILSCAAAVFQIRLEKEALAKKLKAMEGKILKVRRQKCHSIQI
eukprot:scaffold40393_cov20-Tisochrysis_lutea.AAC.1